MSFPFRAFLIFTAIATGFITSYTVFAQEIFDRLDGTGPSGKRVDVIEWEGNLEIHVYPKTSLKGLGAKLDDRTKGKKVMVISYRLGKDNHPLVRRAILGIPFDAKLKAFVDPSEKEFDKLALSNQDLQKPWVPYKLDPAPKQWYPDGDERNEGTPENTIEMKPYLGDTKQAEPANVAPSNAGQRAPASVSQPKTPQPQAPSIDTNEGSVGHFNF